MSLEDIKKSPVIAAKGIDDDIQTGELNEVGHVVDPLEHHLKQHTTKDVALLELENHGALKLSSQAEKRLRWKADLYVTLFLSCVYAAQYMDKLSNSPAAVMGLKKDLNMSSGQYSWVGTSFYLGFLIFQLPMSLVIQRFPIAKVTSITVVLWGVVMLCSAACRNVAGYLACRTILGVLESVITPSFTLITAQWYKREEQFSRILFWCSFNGLGYIIILAAGYGFNVRRLDGTLDIAGWKALFITVGAISFILGVLFWFHIPDTPSEAWFLTEDEVRGHIERIRDNKQGYGNAEFKLYQFIEVFKDLRTYLYFAGMFACELPSGALSSFLSLVIQGIIKDDNTGNMSLLMSLPAGGTEFIVCAINAVLAAYFFTRCRMVWGIFGAAVSVLALCLLAWGPNAGSQLAGAYIWYWSIFPAFTALVSSIASNTAGHTKKVVTSALTMASYAAGSACGPQTFRGPPNYTSGKLAMAVCSVALFVCVILIQLLNVWENRRRDRLGKVLPPDMKNAEFADLTDFENPEFRYAY